VYSTDIKDKEATLLKDKYTKIAIIGNGFDITHGYHTKYEEFAEYLLSNKNTSKDVSRFIEILDGFRLVDKLNHWYDFEKQIKRMVSQYSNAGMIYRDTHHDADEFNSIVKNLTGYLKEYLVKEVDGRFGTIDSVSKELDSDTLAVDFNYTNTISMYGCDVYYVHGSLNEDNIIIGYDGYDDGALDHAYYEHRRWLKDFRRDSIEFIRYLKKQTDYIDCTKARNEFDIILNARNTGRGCEDSDYIGLEYAKYIEDFVNMNSNNNIRCRLYGLNEIDFDAIKTVVSMGHSIQSDKFYLSSILSQCNNIEKVRIFTYDGEKLKDIDVKKKFYSQFVSQDRIRIVKY